MKNYLTFLLTLSFCSVFAQKNSQLEFISIQQLNDYKARFDLSGINIYYDEVLIVADKSDNKFVYVYTDHGNTFTIDNSKYKIDFNGKVDFEGIAVYGDDAYIINESNNEVYRYNLKTQDFNQLPINWEALSVKKEKWLNNAGLEGVAIDPDKGLLYLAKERQPSFVIVVDLQNNLIVKEMHLKKMCSNDIADLFFYKGNLYALERNERCIAKIDPQTSKVLKHYSFDKSVSKKGEKLYEPSKYGMSEALMIKDDTVWVGYDNNDLKVSKFAKERYNLSGSQPVILKFKLND
ncbi:SdiA-regulated domain-containing protein [Flammeovirga sp. SubArs3]|uniref:SdiA-regulated domain-containing protein n=1 Tax=Flammeovirga sp. SubArs3 TaxID=2995316 RepID=UPI00248C7B19|nr:SdiA-regulated domain-containing protein [Flammeovirga sp. SubArs3]